MPEDLRSPVSVKATWQGVVVKNLLRVVAFLVEKILTRTTIEGRENIPKEGPVIFAANHASTYDAVLLMSHLPRQTVMLGPGDFKLDKGSDWILRNYGVILTKRGAVDRRALSEMKTVLKNGGMLTLFPEGGTWEKTLEDVKPGATYLSYSTQAPIVPVAFGGTYQVWDKVFGFKWPRISVRFGEVLPPVQTSSNRKTRQDELQAASYELIKLIYDMLPSEDQATYDRIARQRYSGRLDVEGNFVLPDNLILDGLAEIIEKPNLFAPMVQRAGELLDVLLKPQEFAHASAFYTAAHALQTLYEDDFKGYLEYRVGNDTAQQVYTELSQLITLAEEAQAVSAQLRFRSQVWLVDESEQIEVENEADFARLSG